MPDSTISRVLERYTVQGLFGTRKVDFKLASEGTTLLTGTNGSGKSTVLRSINAIGSGDWLGLQRLPFVTIALRFTDRTKLTVTQSEDKLDVHHDGNNWTFDPGRLAPVDLDEIGSRRIRQVIQVGPGQYEFEGRTYSRKELELLLAMRNLIAEDKAHWVAEIPAWFSVLFVDDLRLIHQPEVRPRYLGRSAPTGQDQIRRAVDSYPREMASHIARSMAQYAAQSQSLDRVFPYKVVEAMSAPQTPNVGEVRQLLDRVRDEREALHRVGILRREEATPEFDESRFEEQHVLPVIKTIAEDSLAKFAVLNDLRTQLEIFLGFLQKHYEGKTVEIDQDRGLTIALADRSPLRPSDLSSGEQQILVLAFQTLFQREAGTLVLIDEPELSLHVLWQSTLVDDLLEMGRARSLRFLLASHSPVLIGDHDELCRSLDH